LPKNISFLADDLIRQLNRELSSTLKITGDVLKGEIKQEVQHLVYQSGYTPKVYEQTHNLERSITKSEVHKDADGISVDVYADDLIAQSHHMYETDQPLESYANVIETGRGYDYGFPFSGRPRRFVGNVVDKEFNGIVGLIDKAVGDAIRKL
jgi:hypothetical protein